MIMSRNSRPQSSSPAGTTPGSASRSSSPRTSTPASTRSVTNGAPSASKNARSISRHSAAPQIPVRRVLAFRITAPRLGEVGGPVDVDVHDPLEMREDRHPRLGLHPADQPLAAARHDARRCSAVIVSISPTAARSVVGTSWIAASGSPAAASPATSPAWIACAERRLSEPPRRIAAFPAFRHSAPASAVTFGRLSKITPTTPSGVRTRRMCRPEGRSHSAITCPTGSGCAGDRAQALDHAGDPRLGQLQPVEHRARRALRRPAAMSAALAARSAARSAQIASAAARSAASFCAAGAIGELARRGPRLLAHRPASEPRRSHRVHAPSARYFRSRRSERQVVAVHQRRPARVAEQLRDPVRAVAHDDPRLEGIVARRAPCATTAPSGPSTSIGSPRRKPPSTAGDPGRQQRLAPRQRRHRAGVDA